MPLLGGMRISRVFVLNETPRYSMTASAATQSAAKAKLEIEQANNRQYLIKDLEFTIVEL